MGKIGFEMRLFNENVDVLNLEHIPHISRLDLD
jgi:hypothetical protein